MARKEWTKEDTFELISLYEQNCILWDSKSAEYRNRDRKQETWQTIATKFGCTTDEVQRKLHNLRNQVSQEIKKFKRKKSGENYVSNWPYFGALKFLIPVLTGSQGQSMSSQSSKQDTINWVESESEEKAPVHDNRLESKRRRKLNKRKYRGGNGDDALLAEALETLRKPPDEDDLFGQYVAMELKGLRSDFNRRRLKSEIRKAVARIADEDDLYVASSSANLFISPPSSAFCVQYSDSSVTSISMASPDRPSEAD